MWFVMPIREKAASATPVICDPEIGQKIGKGHGLAVKKQGVCGKIPDCGRQKQKSEGSENGKCV